MYLLSIMAQFCLNHCVVFHYHHDRIAKLNLVQWVISTFLGKTPVSLSVLDFSECMVLFIGVAFAAVVHVRHTANRKYKSSLFLAFSCVLQGLSSSVVKAVMHAVLHEVVIHPTNSSYPHNTLTPPLLIVARVTQSQYMYYFNKIGS